MESAKKAELESELGIEILETRYFKGNSYCKRVVVFAKELDKRICVRLGSGDPKPRIERALRMEKACLKIESLFSPKRIRRLTLIEKNLAIMAAASGAFLIELAASLAF